MVMGNSKLRMLLMLVQMCIVGILVGMWTNFEAIFLSFVFKCVSVAVYMWLPAKIGRQACYYKYACIFYEKCWVMLLNFWYEKIAFVLEINKS